MPTHYRRECPCGKVVKLIIESNDVPTVGTGKKVACECGLEHEDHWIMKNVHIEPKGKVSRAGEEKCFSCGKDATCYFPVRVPVLTRRTVFCCDSDECQDPKKVEARASEMAGNLLNAWL